MARTGRAANRLPLAGLLILGVLVGGGCGWAPWRRDHGAVERVTVTTADVEHAVRLRVAPSYRLLPSPALVSAATRLFVLHANLENVSGEILDFEPGRARLVLPDGTEGRVFDRSRAAELVRRTALALPGPEAGGDSRAGGPDILREPVLSRLRIEIVRSLLGPESLDPREILEGYVVIDTERPLSSLGGVMLEILATRVRDETVVREAYEFAQREVAPPHGGM
jgi:hypothetical protein